MFLSNTVYSYGWSLTASVLPELARPEAFGKVSGWCFGFVSVTMLITAVIYGTAASVTFWLLREHAASNPDALHQLGFKASLDYCY